MPMVIILLVRKVAGRICVLPSRQAGTLSLRLRSAVLQVGLAPNAPMIDCELADWSPPENVAAANTVALEFPGSISKDGLTLYFQRRQDVDRFRLDLEILAASQDTKGGAVDDDVAEPESAGRQVR
jgi:hypothetical protein